MIGRAVRQIRRNHALEHGTVTVLLERGVRPPIGGYSTRRGFFIFTGAPVEAVQEAAMEALGRFVQGERKLAISPHCGTNMVTNAVLAGLFTAAVLGKRGWRLSKIPAVAVGVLGANLLSRPIGNELQRRYTTLSDLADMEILSVRSLMGGRIPVHRVTTRMSTPQDS